MAARADNDLGAQGGERKQKRWTAKEAARVVAAWQRSGLSQADYCRRNGLATHRLSYWVVALRDAKEASKAQTITSAKNEPRFLPVIVRGFQSTQPGGQGEAEKQQDQDGGMGIEPEWAARFVRELFSSRRAKQ